MTEDSTQLSVAELLARNGQQGGSAGGGGRRRRSGRGLSVADLTGDVPIVPGSSSHAAPDEAEPASEPAASDSDYSNYSNYSDYSNFSYETPQQDTSYSYSTPDSANEQSPLSGPISYYDPLSQVETPSARSLSERSGYDWNSSGQMDWPPAESEQNGRNGANGYDAPSNGYGANGYAAPVNGAAQVNGLAPSVDRPQGGRRRKPDPLSDPLSPVGDVGFGGIGAEPSAPPAETGGRRRRRFDPDDDTTTDVRPFRGAEAGAGLDLPPWGAPKAEPLPNNSPEASAAPPMSRSARRHAERQAESAREAESWHGAPLDDEARRVAELPRGGGAESPAQRGADFPRNGEPQRGFDFPRNGDQRGAEFGGGAEFPRNGEPQRGAEFPRKGGGWRGAEPVQGDPAQADDPRRGADAQRGERAGAAAGGLPAWSARRRQPTEPDRGPGPRSDDRDAGWPLAQQDQQLLSGETVAGDLLRDAHDHDDEPRSRRARRSGERSLGKRAFGRKSRPAEPDDIYEGATDIYSPLLDEDEFADDERPSMAERFGALATRTRRARPAKESDEDENRRQWMILGGQSAGAAIAGMLLFKGFERMWEMLPWVALALAMIVILGLVALVRVLRRTDDIFSTVIAVVVGVFVTLGPLAFLLSTT
ncbi:hypothetical protein [Nocardia sp. NPDC050406]|uniref:hypothetical protein n=1 Tax=Nocardia sp. NPDC050406 TaxID=3364318 RepID=UPI0037A6D03D